MASRPAAHRACAANCSVCVMRQSRGAAQHGCCAVTSPALGKDEHVGRNWAAAGGGSQRCGRQVKGIHAGDAHACSSGPHRFGLEEQV